MSGSFQNFSLFGQIGGGSFPKPLNAEEEAKYIKLYANGNDEEKKEAKNILIERNLRLVAHIVKKYNSKESEDLISIGTIGLIKAIISFDASKGTRLATFASRCIDNEILMHLRSSKKYGNEMSLQDPIGVDKEGNEVTMEDKLANDSYSIDEQIFMKMQVKLLYNTIKEVLDEREKLVIELRYGLALNKEVIQRDIAKMLGISRSYVSRIEKKALQKLKEEITRVEGSGKDNYG